MPHAHCGAWRGGGRRGARRAHVPGASRAGLAPARIMHGCLPVVKNSKAILKTGCAGQCGNGAGDAHAMHIICKRVPKGAYSKCSRAIARRGGAGMGISKMLYINLKTRMGCGVQGSTPDSMAQKVGTSKLCVPKSSRPTWAVMLRAHRRMRWRWWMPRGGWAMSLWRARARTSRCACTAKRLARHMALLCARLLTLSCLPARLPRVQAIRYVQLPWPA